MEKSSLEILNQFNEELRCSICLGLFQKPVLIDSNQVYCKNCIDPALELKNECPNTKIRLLTKSKRPVRIIETLVELYMKVLPKVKSSEERQKNLDQKLKELAIQNENLKSENETLTGEYSESLDIYHLINQKNLSNEELIKVLSDTIKLKDEKIKESDEKMLEFHSDLEIEKDIIKKLKNDASLNLRKKNELEEIIRKKDELIAKLNQDILELIDNLNKTSNEKSLLANSEKEKMEKIDDLKKELSNCENDIYDKKLQINSLEKGILSVENEKKNEIDDTIRTSEEELKNILLMREKEEMDINNSIDEAVKRKNELIEVKKKTELNNAKIQEYLNYISNNMKENLVNSKDSIEFINKKIESLNNQKQKFDKNMDSIVKSKKDRLSLLSS